MTALKTDRQHEWEYRKELDSIRWEIEFLLDFLQESRSHLSLAPMVEELLEKEALIERALRRPTLPPLPDQLRNPIARPRSPAEKEYIRLLIKDCRERAKHAPAE